MAYSRKRRRGSNGFFRNVGSAAMTAAKYALEQYSRSNTDTGRRAGSGTGVTSQYDKANQYRYKRMPKKKKRKYVRKVKNFKSMQLQQLATQIFIRNSITGGSAAPAVQGATAVHLAGISSGTETGGDDLLALADRSPPETGVDAGLTDPRMASSTNSAFILDSGILDTTFRNTGTSALEVDVYHITYTRDYETAGGLGTLFSVGQVPDGITGVVADITISSRGVTPFDFPKATQQGMKVMKKTKYFIPAGQTFTYQLKKTTNKKVFVRDLKNLQFEFRQRYLTETLLFVAKTVVGETATGTWSIGTTRRYAYRILQNNKMFGQIIG